MSDIAAIAVIGHTNTGKTSLLRTLTRQRDFGEISAHPATTRHVELAELAVDGQPVLQLYDTPGFEDSSGLLAHIEQLKSSRGEDWVETLRAFAVDNSLHASFGQEAKALAQILDSDVLLYVIDARDPVRAKHRDELELLGRCARPVVNDAVLPRHEQSTVAVGGDSGEATVGVVTLDQRSLASAVQIEGLDRVAVGYDQMGIPVFGEQGTSWRCRCRWRRLGSGCRGGVSDYGRS